MLRRVLLMAGIATLVTSVLVTGSTFADRGGNGGGGGNNTATIDLVSPQTANAGVWPIAGDAVSFAVTANVKDRDLYNLWVANKCSQDGVAVYAAYLPVQDGQAGPFTLNWTGGGPAECTAYVWMFPSTETPLRGASMTYSAGP